MIYENVLALIGKTPLVRIRKLNPNPKVEILAKLEYFNPGGSVKDRAAFFMIEEAERNGELTKEKIILEATSGNTGIGLALVAAVKGYRILLVMSESVSQERIKILKAFGAEILFTPAHLSTDGAIEYAYRLAREEPDKYWLADQFNNHANWKAHYYGTAMEIWEDTRGQLDMVVATMGTSGTLMGVSRRMAELSKDIKVVGVEPYFGHKIQGLKNMKESYPPGIYERHRLYKVINIEDELAYETARKLAKLEGIFVGMSSGAAMAGALKMAEELEEGRIVVILPDTGERYLSTSLFLVKKTPGIKIFNTLSRTVEELIPIEENKVKIYCCGPILNQELTLNVARRFVIADIICKYLRWKGLETELVTNVTDIDEKTIRSAEVKGQSLEEYSGHLFKIFLEDLKSLNITEPISHMKASENVDKMIEVVERLTQKGYAYEKFRSVYFDISRLKPYGSLSKVDLSKIQVGKTVDLDQYEKDNPRDFTLLKRATLSDLKKGTYYETRWGKVRPSWHLECAALGSVKPGIPYDLHISGLELLFPHNENTFAIGYALLDRIPCRYWLHVDQVEFQRDKSGGEEVAQEATVKEFMGLLNNPRALRYLLLSRNYRRKILLTQKDIRDAELNIFKLDWTIQALMTAPTDNGSGELKQGIYDLKAGFFDSLEEDLNLPRAIGVLFRFVKKLNESIEHNGIADKVREEILSLFRQIDSVLGVFSFSRHPDEAKIKEMVSQRERFRERRDWAEADRLRDELKNMGVNLVDTPKGTLWTWVSPPPVGG